MIPFQLETLAGQLALGLAIAGAVLIMAQRWRPTLAALFAQYLLMGLLLAESMPSWVAGIKILVGTMSCMILYGTHYYLQELAPLQEVGEQGWGGLAADRLGIASRTVSIVLVGGMVYFLLGSIKMPVLSSAQSFGCYWLIAIGCLALVLASSSLEVGVGVLSIQMGFELFYTVQESALSVMGLLGVVDLFMALAIAYLISGPRLSSLGWEED